MLLGAQGINIGTRFLTSVEATISDEWKQAILAAESQDAIKVKLADSIIPPPRSGGYQVLSRTLRTPFVEEWNQHPDAVKRKVERLSREVMAAILQGRGHELLPFTGQTAGMIHEILPAAEIVRNIVSGAEEALHRAVRLLS